MSDAIILHEESVQRRRREAQAGAIRAARSRLARQDLRSPVSVRAALQPPPFRGFCSRCRLLLVEDPQGMRGCVCKPLEVAPARPASRVRVSGDQTSLLVVWIALVVMGITFGAAWLSAQHERDTRAGTSEAN